MIQNFGIVKPGSKLYIPFATYDSNDPSASVTMSGFATTDIEIYKDGSTTQRTSDNGYALLDTDGTDFDGLTGIHGFSIDLADNSDAGFYACGSQYWVVISAITVDSATVSFIAATFTIGYPDAILNTSIASLANQTSFTLGAGPADDNALVGCICIIHDIASAVQIAQSVVSAYTGSTRTVTLAFDPGIYTISAKDNIAFFPGVNVRSISEDKTAADNAELMFDGTGYAGGTTKLKIDLDTIKTQTITCGAGVTVRADVGAAAAPGAANGMLIGGSNAATSFASITTTGNVISWNAAWDAEVQSEVQDAIELNNLDHLMKVATASGDMTAEVADNTVLSRILSNGDTSVFDPSTDGLQPFRDENLLEHDATQSAIAGIGSSSGASLNFAVSDDNVDGAIPSTPYDNTAVSFVGNQDAGTYADTSAAGGAIHTISDTGNVIRIVYKFNIGASRNAAAVSMFGRITAGDTLTIKAWNGTTDSWDLRKTIIGAGANATHDIKLLAEHTETGAYAGQIFLLFECATDSVLYVDELLCSGVSIASTTGYADGAVWVKATGTSGQTPDVNGTADNPCPWADAIVIAAAKGLSRFRIINGETVTLDAACESKSLIGSNWTLVMGGQSISGSYFEGCTVTGSGSGSTSVTFIDCKFGDGSNNAVIIPPMVALRCGINCVENYPLTAATAGNGQYVFTDCYSLVAGSATPYFNFSPVTGTSGINFRRWSGGSHITADSNCTGTMEVVTGGGQTIVTGGASWELRGICRAVTVTLTGDERVRIDAITGPVVVDGSGTGSTVTVYGITHTVTESAANPTINNYSVSQSTINTQVDVAFTDYDPPTNAEMEARTLVSGDYATLVIQTGIKAKTDLLPAINPGESGGLPIMNGDYLDVNIIAVEGDETPIDSKSLAAALRYIAAICAGKISGAGTGTEIFKGLDGSTDRVTVSVDESGNRTGVTYD